MRIGGKVREGCIATAEINQWTESVFCLIGIPIASLSTLNNFTAFNAFLQSATITNNPQTITWHHFILIKSVNLLVWVLHKHWQLLGVGYTQTKRKTHWGVVIERPAEESPLCCWCVSLCQSNQPLILQNCSVKDPSNRMMTIWLGTRVLPFLKDKLYTTVQVNLPKLGVQETYPSCTFPFFNTYVL